MHEIAMAALGARASRPHPAGGRQWTTRRGPTGVPGSACVPPAPGRRPAMDDRPKAHRCVQAGKMPALPGKAPPVSSYLPKRLDALDPRGPRSVPGTACVPLGPRASCGPPACGPQWARHRWLFLGSPATRRVPPAVGRRPTGVFLGARASRPHEGRRPTGVPGSAGVPACGPKAHRCSWERGRPARMWAEGPQVFLGARASRPHVGRRPTGVPGTAGVPPACGPKAHRCVKAGKMPALPGAASADRVDLPGETQNRNCCRGLMPQAAVQGLQATPAGPISAHREVGGPRAGEVA